MQLSKRLFLKAVGGLAVSVCQFGSNDGIRPNDAGHALIAEWGTEILLAEFAKR